MADSDIQLKLTEALQQLSVLESNVLNDANTLPVTLQPALGGLKTLLADLHANSDNLAEIQNPFTLIATSQGIALPEAAALKATFDLSGISLAMTNGEGRWLYVNRAFEQLLGYTNAELTQLSMKDVTHPDDVGISQENINKVMTGQLDSYRIEKRYLHKNGAQVWVDLSVTPVRNEKGEIAALLGAGMDISAQKKAEEQIRFQANLLQQISEAVISSDKTYHITSWNKAAELIYGWTENEVKGKFIGEVLDTKFLDTSPDKMIQEISENGSWSGEICQTRKDGSKVFILTSVSKVLDTNGRHIGFVAIDRDITERKLAEEKTNQSEESMRKAQQVAHVGSWRWNIKSNSLEWSDEMYRIFGIDKLTFTGSLPDIIARAIHPDDRAAVDASNLSVIERGKPIPLEYRIIWPDGSVRVVWAEAGELMLDKDGKPAYLTGIVQDITERKHAELALIASEEKYRLLFENMTAGFGLHEMIYDEQGNPIDYRFLEVNPAFEKLTGLNSASLIGKTVKEVLPSIEQYWIDTYGRVARTGEPTAYINYARELGKYYDTWVFSPAKDQFAVVFYDVTLRIQAEEVLRQSEAKYSSIFDQSPIAIEVYDQAGKLSFINDACAKMFGIVDPNEILGFKLFDDPNVTEEVKQHLLKNETVRVESHFDFDLVKQLNLYQTIHSGIRTLDYIITPMMVNSEPFGYVVQIQDITERKQSEESLHQSEKLFRQLAENIREVLWVRDYRTRRMEYVSPAYEEVFGRTCASLYEDPESFGADVHPDDVERVRQAAQAQYQGILFHEDYRIIWPDGSIRWVHARTYPVHDENGQIQRLVGIAEDITKSKQAEEETQYEQRRLNSLLKISQLKTATKKELLDISLEEAVALTNSQIGYLAFYDEQKKEIHFQGWSSQVWAECTIINPQFVYTLDQTGIWGESIRQRRPLIINEFHKPNPLKKGFPTGHVPIDNFMSIPIFEDGSIVAVVGVANKSVNYTSLDARQLLMMMEATWKMVERKQHDELIRRLSHAIEQSPSYLIITDSTDRIEYVNPRFTELTGYSLEELQGKNLGFLHTDITPPETYREIQEVIQTGERWQGELCNRKKNGELFWVSTAISPIKNEAGAITHYARLSEDITRRKQAEAEKEKQLEHVRALRTIDQAIISSFDLSNTLRVCIDQVIGQLHVDAVSILRLNPKVNIFEFAASDGFRTDALKHTRLRMGEGFAGRAALHRKTIYIPNLAREKGTLIRSYLLDKEEFTTYFGIPLIVKGRINGVMEIFLRKPFEPDPEWQEFLEIVAGQIAIAIDNSDLFENLQRSLLELEMAYDETLEGWSHALAMRDQDTETHSEASVDMTLQMARALNLPEEDIVQIRRGALLHDIGKIAIRDNILLKEGPLTPEEWDIMRQHTKKAYDLIYPIKYLRPCLDIPYCHHEKWDGTGYPRGLKGEEIPLSARIFAIADVWNALRSDRPYRPAWSKDKALDYIQSQSGQHFDPQVVEMFVQILNEDNGYFDPN